jgi:prepilin-type N-terminal cleavage/methylation domain-containing protein
MTSSAARRGFTLIELLVVISIISLLSSVILTSVNDARQKARDSRRVADLIQMRTALELYYAANGKYPLPAGCSYDENCYALSYRDEWLDPESTLARELRPYLATLPRDPLNSGECPPWNGDGCYSYSYGNVGNSDFPPQYDLTARFENPNHPQRCTIRQYVYHHMENHAGYWCASALPYPSAGQVYEASP